MITWMAKGVLWLALTVLALLGLIRLDRIVPSEGPPEDLGLAMKVQVYQGP